MKSIAPMLEQELAGAVDIKDKGFLHRYITLMAENFVQKEEHVTEVGSIRSDIQILAESMRQNFEGMDKRFEDMLSFMDKRFEAMDKRFEDMQNHMGKRFEAMDKRFEDMQKHMAKRFEAVDKRFGDMNKRFDDMNKRFTMMFSFVTIGFIVVSTLVTVYQFLG